MLTGSEVKSLRDGKANLSDSYGIVRNGEIFLLNLHISPYERASYNNHEPTRTRKLLLHKREIRRLIGAVERQGLTLVPLELYFKRGVAKVAMALGKGKKLHDKRGRREAARRRPRDRARGAHAMIVALATAFQLAVAAGASTGPRALVIKDASRSLTVPLAASPQGPMVRADQLRPVVPDHGLARHGRAVDAHRRRRRRSRWRRARGSREWVRISSSSRARPRSGSGVALRPAAARRRAPPARRRKSRVGSGALRASRVLVRRAIRRSRRSAAGTCAPPPRRGRDAERRPRSRAFLASGGRDVGRRERRASQSTARRRRCRTRRARRRHAWPDRTAVRE